MNPSLKKSAENLAEFLKREWHDKGLTNEDTIFQRKFPLWAQGIVVLLIAVMSLYPLLESKAIQNFQRTIILTAKTFLQEDFKPDDDHTRFVVQALKFFPRNHVRNLQKVKIQHGHKNSRRGMANEDTIILSPHDTNPAEFIAVLIHELGHVTDLGELKPDGSVRRKTEFADVYATDPSLNFYRISWLKENKPKDIAADYFLSGYAQSNVFEDFAESYNFYVLHGPEFRARGEKSAEIFEKYTFLKNVVFSGKEFDFRAKDYAYADEFYDTTVLPYDFQRFLAVADDSDDSERDEDERVRRARRRPRPTRSRIAQNKRSNQNQTPRPSQSSATRTSLFQRIRRRFRS